MKRKITCIILALVMSFTLVGNVAASVTVVDESCGLVHTYFGDCCSEDMSIQSIMPLNIKCGHSPNDRISSSTTERRGCEVWSVQVMKCNARVIIYGVSQQCGSEHVRNETLVRLEHTTTSTITISGQRVCAACWRNV